MYKIIALTKFQPALTLEQGRRYWSNVHGPIALNNRLIRRYLQDHWVTPLQSDELLFHGNSEIWYDDEAEYVATMESPEWAGLVDDGPNVFDYSTIVSGIVEEHVVRADATIGMGAKAMWAFKFDSGQSKDEARRYWQKQHAALVLSVAGVTRYEQNVAVKSADVKGLTADAEPFEGRIDGLFSVWFDDNEARAAAMASPQWSAAIDDTANFVEPGSLHGALIDEHVKR